MPHSDTISMFLSLPKEMQEDYFFYNPYSDTIADINLKLFINELSAFMELSKGYNLTSDSDYNDELKTRLSRCIELSKKHYRLFIQHKERY